DADGKIQSKVTGNCLRHFGFSEDRAGVKAALLARKAFAVYDAGGYSDLMTGEEALAYWEANGTNVGGSFNINPPIPRILLAQAKRPDGSFVVDGISTDGGCIPRNVILSQGLSLVKLDVLTLPEFVQKTSLNPARMLRLANKGHLSVGADADITVYDYATQEPRASFVMGRKVLAGGKVVAKGASVICTERGAEAIKARGMDAIVVDPGQQIERIKAL
ncbi:MAG: amidohydrolase family protein, partial [Duodenibacillus sp.]|nr:amidohydrolase family protein [Duodenibacillus sp.]